MENNGKVLKQLQESQMFKFFDVKALEQLVETGTVRQYKKDAFIIREGEIDDLLFIIINGSVSVTVTESTRDVYICTIGPGEVFGEAGIFSKVKRTANIVSTEETSVLSLTRESLLTFIKNNSTSGIQLLMIVIYSLLRKLRTVNQDLAYERKSDIGQEDIDQIIMSIMSNK